MNLQEIFSKDELIKYEKEFKGNMEFQKALNSFKNYTLEYNRILLNYSKKIYIMMKKIIQKKSLNILLIILWKRRKT